LSPIHKDVNKLGFIYTIKLVYILVHSIDSNGKVGSD